MSFILDALRKSESDRQREAGPTLAHVPLAVTEQTVPLWIWVVMGTLATVIIVLAGLWWQVTRQPGDSIATTTLVAPEASRVAPDPSRAAPEGARVAPEASRVATTSPTPRAAPPESGPALATPAPTPAPQDAAPAARPTAAPRSGSNADLRTFRSVPELMASGFAIPELVFELHVFDPDPGRRSVFFSGSVYREGQRIANGPQIVEITPEGVILEQDGRLALLRRQ